jgi:hypothetical protein
MSFVVHDLCGWRLTPAEGVQENTRLGAEAAVRNQDPQPRFSHFPSGDCCQ